MSLRMSLTRVYVRRRYRYRHDLERMQRELPTRQEPAPVPQDVEDLCEVTRETVLDRPVVTLAPRNGATGTHVVHLHGGAYVYAVQPTHWRVLAQLVQTSGATFHVPSYSLAPGATVDDAYPLLDAVVDRVQVAAGDGRVFLSGDSAGGGLALGQAIRMRNDGRQAASAVLLFSPWVDVTLTNPDIERLERRDPMLSRAMLVQAGRWWAGDRSPADPVVSPVRDNLADLPPVFTYIGGRDLLVADARKLDQRIRAVGGQSTLRVWPSGFHVFMAAQSTREAQEVMVDVSCKLRSVA